MEKLNSKSKFTVKAGDILKDSANEYTIISIWTKYRPKVWIDENGKIQAEADRNNTVTYTLGLNDNGVKKTIYALPASECYGMEIIRK